jgi:hypothetical protein
MCVFKAKNTRLKYATCTFQEGELLSDPVCDQTCRGCPSVWRQSNDSLFGRDLHVNINPVRSCHRERLSASTASPSECQLSDYSGEFEKEVEWTLVSRKYKKHKNKKNHDRYNMEY